MEVSPRPVWTIKLHRYKQAAYHNLAMIKAIANSHPTSSPNVHRLLTTISAGSSYGTYVHHPSSETGESLVIRGQGVRVCNWTPIFLPTDSPLDLPHPRLSGSPFRWPGTIRSILLSLIASFGLQRPRQLRFHISEDIFFQDSPIAVVNLSNFCKRQRAYGSVEFSPLGNPT